MKAKKIWMAQHPTQPCNFEVCTTEPNDSGTYISSTMHNEDGEYVQWKEYVLIEVES